MLNIIRYPLTAFVNFQLLFDTLANWQKFIIALLFTLALLMHEFNIWRKSK